MKILLFVVLLLMITIMIIMPTAMGHAKIIHTHPASVQSQLSESVNAKEYQRDFFTVLIGSIVITMTVVILIIYCEDIPYLKNFKIKTSGIKKNTL